MLLAGECLIDLQEYDLAIAAYRQYVQKQPANMRARAAYAAALYSRGKLAEARRELEEVLRTAPDTPRANYTMGAVLFELKYYPEARAQFVRELALDARCTSCASRLAHIAYLEGDDAKCKEWLGKSLALDPDDIESHLVSGMLALRSGDYADAVEHLTRVVDRSPDFPTARFQLSTAYRRAGNPEKAQEQFEVYQRLLKEQKAREIGVRGSL
jgi:tetratricopeptide (TPR) repeat protein